jgi:hypothetical protein
MKIICFLFVFYSSSFYLELKATATMDENASRSICGTSEVYFDIAKNVRGGEETLHFRSEPLTESNYTFWKNFANYQETRAQEQETRAGGKHRLRIGLDAFKMTLDVYVHSRKHLIDVCFCSREDLSQDINAHPNFSAIEMVLTLFTQPNCPLTSHLGIMRGYDFYGYVQPQHPHIAMLMHGFAAAASRIIDPNVKYMTTRPSQTMARIFQEYFSQHAFPNPAGGKEIPQQNLLYYPGFTSESPEGSVPIDNTDNNFWQLYSMDLSTGKRIDSNPIKFLRPFWFSRNDTLFGQEKSWEHPILSNPQASLPPGVNQEFKQKWERVQTAEQEHLIAVSIEGLSAVWYGK